jgi:catechol 2,3-dioxygenase-like lactoylglutathione lyase family enzyme/DNA-binding CsgD family transcriptional regulator
MVKRGRGRPPHPDVLTPAEWAVLDSWRHGMTRRVIADRRGMSAYGVRYHLRNIAGKLGVATIAELRHWPGFAAGSAMAARRTNDMTDDPQLGPLGQVSMVVRDAARTEAWYRDVLGLPHVFTFGDLVFFDCGGTRLYIRQVDDADWRPSSILYFLVPDIEVAHRTLSERGVAFKGAPHLIYEDDETHVEEWMAFFDDPDGNTLALMARVQPGADSTPGSEHRPS